MEEPIYKALVEDNGEYDLLLEEIENLDIQPLGPGRFHVVDGQESFEIRVESVDPNERTYSLRMKGASYNIQLKDKYALLVDRLGLSTVAGHQLSEIHAPMPGLVIDILVQPGEEVEEGDSLLILEAMKMENVIKAAGTGVVATIEAQKGQAVEKGQLLIRME